MPVIHDLRCKGCDAEFPDQVVDPNDFPACPLCGGERTWVPAGFATDTWGSPRYIASLDQEFGSRSELRAHLRAHGLEEAGDRVGGARNESHLGLGKKFGFAGQSRHD